MPREWLEKRYHKTAAYCKDCGRLLKSPYGEPLGRYFVMDIHGEFYCMGCDDQFEDGDEEIYIPVEDESEEE